MLTFKNILILTYNISNYIVLRENIQYIVTLKKFQTSLQDK